MVLDEEVYAYEDYEVDFCDDYYDVLHVWRSCFQMKWTVFMIDYDYHHDGYFYYFTCPTVMDHSGGL